MAPGSRGDSLVPVPVSSGSIGSLGHGSSGQLTHASLSGMTSAPVGHAYAGGTGSASSGTTGGVSSGSTAQPPKQSSSQPKKPKEKIVYKTITRTVVRVVPPAIPSGAVLPSSLVVSTLSFTVLGGNIVCVLDAAGARCDVAQHRWTPPHKRPTCHQNWSPGIMVNGTSKARFVCSNKTILGGPKVPTIKPGYDDIVGNTRCEVRMFGVDCYIDQHHGFLISRTAYVRF